MLKRQKVLLDVLHCLGERVTRTRLVKLCFLLSAESCLSTDPSFYDFVPYRFGPFSFALYRELGALQRDGYIAAEGDVYILKERNRRLSEQKIGELPSRLRQAVEQLVAEYSSLEPRELLRVVYHRYPWYATRSELREVVQEWPAETPSARIAVYTVGYEQKSVDRFFAELLKAGMGAILDVRANPVSRKYGFAKSSMSEIGAKLGIVYHHLPSLGIPGSERARLSDRRSYQRLLDRYEFQMLPPKADEVKRLIALIRERPSALLCMEGDVTCCHRGRLAAVASRMSGLDVVHL